jgi:hypothetical protein
MQGGMRGLQRLAGVLLVAGSAAAGVVGPAAAQGFETTSIPQSGFGGAQDRAVAEIGGHGGGGPISLMPGAFAAPLRSDGFALMAAEPAAATPARRETRAAAAATPDAATPAAGRQAALAGGALDVPLPPPRPFNLKSRNAKARRTRAVLLAKRPAPADALSPMVRSLVEQPEPEEGGLDIPGIAGATEENAVRTASLSQRSAALDDAAAGSGRGGSIVKQTPYVRTECFGPDLVSILRKASRHFGRPIVVTSGQRAGGRRGSLHRTCRAADTMIEGVSKQVLAAYFRSLPEAGGVGTYCHNGVVHVDTGEPRNWSYCGLVRTSFSLRGGGFATRQERARLRSVDPAARTFRGALE